MLLWSLELGVWSFPSPSAPDPTPLRTHSHLNQLPPSSPGLF